MPRPWTPEDIGRLMRGFQPACVLMAGAELDVFGALAEQSATADGLAARLGTGPRATAMLLDALAALELLEKQDGVYSCPAAVAAVLTASGEHSSLAMAQHLANCLRSWAQLARVVETGQRAERVPSVRGAEGDLESFIEAMNDVSRDAAPPLVAELMPLSFRHLLDVGGATGTWTLAFLRAVPEARATLFDQPAVIPMAERRLTDEGLIDRVTLVAGDYNADPLPAGADFAWVSAIVHQNSPAENTALYARVFDALVPGGRIAIRDVVMDPSHTAPVGGALFAINMLVNTPGGGTFTLDELREGLEAAGFIGVTLDRTDPWMNSIVTATKPASR